MAGRVFIVAGGYRAFLWRPPKHNRTVRVVAGSGASQITPGTVISVVRLTGGELMQDIHEESLNESVKSSSHRGWYSGKST